MKEFTQFLPYIVLCIFLGGMLVMMFSFAGTLNKVSHTQQERIIEANRIYKIIEDNNKLLINCIK